MGALVYRGKPIEIDRDVGYREYVDGKKAADLNADQVDALINSGLTAYADKSYVDTQDAKLATKAYIDAQDNLRLKLANKGMSIAPLDALARIPTQYIDAPLTQRYVRGPWSPDTYLANDVSLAAETTLFVCNIADPGYPYRLVVFGGVDLRSNVDGEYGIINIRAGTPTGEIIAQGLGSPAADNAVGPTAGDDFNGSLNTGPWATGWAVTNLGPTNGGYLHNGGGSIYWADSGASPNRVFYRRTDPGSDKTSTDYQRIQTQISAIGESPGGGGSQWFGLVGRMDEDQQNYVYTVINRASTSPLLTATMGYKLNGVEYQMSNGVNGFVGTTAVLTEGAAGSTFDFVCGTMDGARVFQLWQAGLRHQFVDTLGVTQMGEDYRGWGFHAYAADRPLAGTQTSPPSLAYMAVGDAPPNSKMVSVIPVNNTNMQVRTGSTTLYVRGVRSGSSSTIKVYDDIQPNLFPIAFPAGA